MWPILISFAAVIGVFFSLYWLPEDPRLAGALATAATVGALFVVAYYTYETRQLRVASEKQLLAAHRPVLVIEDAELRDKVSPVMDPGLRLVPAKQLCLVNHGMGCAVAVKLAVRSENLRVMPGELAALRPQARVWLTFQDGDGLDSRPMPFSESDLVLAQGWNWRSFQLDVGYSDVLGNVYRDGYRISNTSEGLRLMAEGEGEAKQRENE